MQFVSKQGFQTSRWPFPGHFDSNGDAHYIVMLVNTFDSAMHHFSRTTVFSTRQLLPGLLMLFAAFSASGQTVELERVNIFGDGNPDNGVEDSREQIMGGRRRVISLADQHMAAGTVKCDGKIRGTAMVVDTREFAPGFNGAVLASAAHIFYDLDNKKRFRRCEFHFLGLVEQTRYRAKIDLKYVRMGGFDPVDSTGEPAFGEGDWAFLYIPRPWKNFNPGETLALRDFSYLQMESFQQSGGEFRLIAFDSSAGVISVSRNCTVIESSGDDLGGGTWKGQLLDDCDSEGGASGGGIVAVVDDRQYLIGIRNGSHWSEQVFPAAEFPLGPPDGSVWDSQSNTNFGRAIDARLLGELREFIQGLVNMNTFF